MHLFQVLKTPAAATIVAAARGASFDDLKAPKAAAAKSGSGSARKRRGATGNKPGGKLAQAIAAAGDAQEADAGLPANAAAAKAAAAVTAAEERSDAATRAAKVPRLFCFCNKAPNLALFVP